MEYIKKNKWHIMGFVGADIILFLCGFEYTLAGIKDLSLTSIINITVHVIVFLFITRENR